MQAIKQAIKNILPAPVLKLYYGLRQKQPVKATQAETPIDAYQTSDYALDFDRVYDENLFENEESVSGTGSTLDQTMVLRQELPVILAKLKTKVLLDIPCGDFNWMQHVDHGDVKYIGGDIVEKLIARNNAQFGRASRSFQKLDLVAGELPEADTIFCRDCLVHLNFEQCRKVIRNVKRNRIRYFLTTTFSERTENVDLTAGIWRTLNLQAAPFNFPKPILLLNEECTEANNQFADKCIGVWKVVDLPDL